jgi:hypothetical protein
MADARTVWKQRIAKWRASGERVEVFCAQHGLRVGTLKWWAWKLGREATPAPVVRVAHLVRSPAADTRQPRIGSIIIEALDARVRVTVEPGADRETLGMVLAVLGAKS